MAKKTAKVVEIATLWEQNGLEPKALRALRREVVEQFTTLYAGEAGELGDVEKIHGGDWTIPVGDHNLVIHAENGNLTITGPSTLMPYFASNDEVEPVPAKGKQKAAPAPEPEPPAPPKGKAKKAAPPPVEDDDDDEEEDEEEPAPAPKKTSRRPKA